MNPITHKRKTQYKPARSDTFLFEFKKNRSLYWMVLPGILTFLVFSYIPLFGLIIAFQNYSPAIGIMKSPFVGFKNFIDFFNVPDSFKIIRNTILLNVYGLVFGFPIPIIFALGLNEVKSKWIKGPIQTVSVLPNFLSNVIVAGIAVVILSPQRGMLDNFINGVFGMKRIYFMIEPAYFRTIFVTVTIWKTFGWNAIIYLAAIVGVPVELYESATIDGANKLQRIIHITLPSIKSTIIITLILSLSSILSSNLEMVLLLQNPVTYDVSDVIATYLYRRGLIATGGIPEYSLATAIGFMNSLVSLALILASNALSRKFLGNRIF